MGALAGVAASTRARSDDNWDPTSGDFKGVVSDDHPGLFCFPGARSMAVPAADGVLFAACDHDETMADVAVAGAAAAAVPNVDGVPEKVTRRWVALRPVLKGVMAEDAAAAAAAAAAEIPARFLRVFAAGVAAVGAGTAV